MDPEKDASESGEDKPAIPIENSSPSEQVSPEVPLEPTASTNVNPGVPLEPAASEKVSAEVPLESKGTANVNPDVPLEPAASEKVSAEVPLESKGTANVNPDVPLESVASEKEKPEVPLESIASEKVKPEVPLEPVASEKEKPDVPLESVASEKVSPEVPLEPKALENVNPHVPLEPTMPAQGNPDVPLAPAVISQSTSTYPLEMIIVKSPSSEVEPAAATETNPENHGESKIKVLEKELKPASSNQDQILPPDGNNLHDNQVWVLEPKVPHWPEELNIPGQGKGMADIGQRMADVGQGGNNSLEDQNWILDPAIPYWPPELNYPGQGGVMGESQSKPNGGQGQLNLPGDGNNAFEAQNWILDPAIPYWPPELNYPGQGGLMGEGQSNSNGGQGQLNLPGDGNNAFEAQNWGLDPSIPYWPQELNYPGQGGLMGEGQSKPNGGQGTDMSEGQSNSNGGQGQLNLPGDGNNAFEAQNWGLDPSIPYWPQELNYPGQGGLMGEGQSKPNGGQGTDMSEGQSNSNGGQGQLNLPGDGNNAFEAQNWGLDPSIPYWPPEFNYPGHGQEIAEGAMRPHTATTELSNLPDGGTNSFEEQEWRLELGNQYWPPELNYPGQGQGLPPSQQMGPAQPPMTGPGPTLAEGGSNSFEDQKWQLDPLLQYWYPELNYPGQGQELLEGQQNLPAGGSNLYEEQKWQLDPNPPYESPDLNNQTRAIPATNFPSDGTNLHEDQLWQLEHYPPMWPLDFNIPGQSTGKSYQPETQNSNSMPQMETPVRPVYPASLVPDGGSNAYEDQPWILEKMIDEQESNGNGQLENRRIEGYEQQYDQNCDPCTGQEGNPNSKYTQTRKTMSFTESALAFIDTIAFLDSAPCNTCDVPQPCEENSNEDIWSWIYSTLSDIIEQVKIVSVHQCEDPSKAAVALSAGDQSANNNISTDPAVASSNISVNPQSQPVDLAEDEFNFPAS